MSTRRADEDAALPNPLPRPPDELARLERAWQPPRGLAILTAVNNSYIGVAYVGTAFLFFVLAGILALLMRTQLALPENTLIGPDRYNQLFTMHGTLMMFLFAVPVVEAMGVLLLPNMLGARDLPFPRLSAYAYWAYLIGGLIFFGSLFFDVAPRGGWFMYPPLTSATYSPGIAEDFWLLGIGFIEISAIAGAIEIVIGVLRTRAPGMTLDRIPVFAWSMLVFAALVIFAFPSIIVATALLEIERAFDWPFFDPTRGGDPLLWQHLFWFFGHPEVYIIFLPAAGMVSMIVPTMAQAPLAAYRLVVLALVATGFLSFGLWVHHMFTTGIPQRSLAFFSAASMAVSIPSAIQVFAWIGTLARGQHVRFHTPALFVLGFLLIFLLGGLTGVMVAVVPFDWQAHDTYFVVAHLHYVLFGGMVFPLFAAFYYWMPYVSRKALSERVGRWVFGLLFVGFNVTFFPMHATGLLGMPRRVYTYPADLGWNELNLVSTVGAFVIASGVLLFLVDLVRSFRFSSDENAGNVWHAGTLEWLPNSTYSTRSIPRVADRDPLWNRPTLEREVEEGRWYLPGTATGRRETILTSAIEAEPQAVLQMPAPGWAPFSAAVATALFFAMLTVQLYWLSIPFAVATVVAIVWWVWPSDTGPSHPPVDIGGGITVPVYLTGPSSHAWWATVVLMLVAAASYASLVMSYLYLWTVAPDQWPSVDSLPPLKLVVVTALALVLASAAMLWAQRSLTGNHHARVRVALISGIVLLIVAFACDLGAQVGSGLAPTRSGYAATVGSFLALHAFEGVLVIVLAVYVIARSFAGRLDRVRRGSFEATMLLWHYLVAQWLLGLAVLHGFPRLVQA